MEMKDKKKNDHHSRGNDETEEHSPNDLSRQHPFEPNRHR